MILVIAVLGPAACGDPGAGGDAGTTTDASTGVAEGSASASTTAPTGEGSSGSTDGGGSTGGGDTTADTSSSGAGDSESSTGDVGPMGLPTLGSLVVLGDSISDGGGGAPFYYTLLHADLDAFYGDVQYVNVAQSGSETEALLGQVQDLPAALPGPVAVVITSGGNDMKANIVAVVTGVDGPAKAALQANIAAAQDALLAPNRFGPGVEVHLFEGNIYDASDGVGDFGANDCAFGGGFPTIPTDPFFEAWNAAIAETTEAHGGRAVDMHAWFYGHGYHTPPNWYASDCTHPSTLGHDQLRRLFYTEITGATLP